MRVAPGVFPVGVQGTDCASGDSAAFGPGVPRSVPAGAGAFGSAAVALAVLGRRKTRDLPVGPGLRDSGLLGRRIPGKVLSGGNRGEGASSPEHGARVSAVSGDSSDSGADVRHASDDAQVGQVRGVCDFQAQNRCHWLLLRGSENGRACSDDSAYFPARSDSALLHSALLYR